MKSYNDLVLQPTLIAENVIEEVFTGAGFAHSQKFIDIMEFRRNNLTNNEKTDFVTLTDIRCRDAYFHRVNWFMKCLKSKSNYGRDMLYMWIGHWFAAYLNDSESFKSKTLGEWFFALANS